MKFLTLLSVSVFASLCLAQAPQSPDLTRTPTLYVVGYAHLDTQWRWEYPKVIREYLPDTLHKNFELFEKYPHYIFNFSGANRYRMMKEYYPADYQRLQHYVAAGRWFPAGSSMEESDVNSPSAESIIRQVLYGNEFFRHDFGRASAEYMLPDCFGFPASLPSLLAHAGIKGFSTQKLTWHSSSPTGGPDSPEKTPVGIPFNAGYWVGPDGKGVIAALNPGSYDGNVSYDLSKSDPGNTARDYVDWPKRVELNGKISGLFTDYHYYGTGDVGGSPGEASVGFVEAITTKGKIGETQVGAGPLRVVSSTAEQMFLDIRPAQVSALPRYHGDLELIEHSAGSLSSQAYHKRWNRKNELLADAAERASIAASQFAGLSYPQERLNNAWTLLLGGQFHDIMAGTATPQAYEYSWNDDVLAMNQFAGVLTSASAAVASLLDTQTKGVPIVVYNPLNIAREDVVEATVSFRDGIPPAVRVFGPDGKEVPAQLEVKHQNATVLFQASAPSVGYTVYDVQPSHEPVKPLDNPLVVSESSLENTRYRIKLDTNGNVSSIFDKKSNRELLSSPLRLAFQTEKPHDWPAWNMDWADQQKPPRSYVAGPARIRVVERGPVRVALEIERETEGSKFTQTIRLSGGDAGNRVEFQNAIDWKSSAAALKAVFPLSAANPLATYNWDVGTIQRANNDPNKYEVPSHQWFDLTDKSGAYGVTILSDCKYGSDKPDDNTLRLTLIYTPGLGDGNGRFYSDQATQDWGHHDFVYGLAAHAGNWQSEQTDWQSLRLNQPLTAFAASRHVGTLGRTFSLMSVNTSRVRVLALKKAERNDELVLRMVEMDGRQQKNVQVKFASPVISAREINGQEFPVGTASVSGGALVTSFSPYQLRSFVLKLALPARTTTTRNSLPIALPYDLSVASSAGTKSAPGFDSEGRALPAEMLPEEISWSGIRFKLAPPKEPNALTAKGQTIPLPAGPFRRLYLLAASADEDQKAAFRFGQTEEHLVIQNWSGFIGQWDDRTWNKKDEQLPPRPGAPAGAPPRVRSVMEYTGIKPGFIKRSDVAWFASHRHTSQGEDEPYAYSYLFAYSLEIPPGARSLTLPNNAKIRIMAVTVSDESSEAQPAQPLYDTLDQPQ